MKLSTSNLVDILGINVAAAAQWAPNINDALDTYGIGTPLQVAAFIAQVGHESARLSATVENMNYSAQALQSVFGKYFPTSDLANAYARQPQKIGNRVYANRMGNGDEASGEGFRYRGRGLIQLTGKTQYAAFSQEGDVDFVANPDRLGLPDAAALSAAWFWTKNGLNDLADQGAFTIITKRINGGLNGADDRNALYAKAKSVLGIS